MLEFQRKKDSNLLCTITQRDNSFLPSSEQSKTLYDYILKHDSQINEMKSELYNLKSQIIDIVMKSSFSKNTPDNNINNSNENNNLYLTKIKQFKNEIKSELKLSINDMVNDSIKQYKEKFENIKEELLNYDDKNNKKKILEINNCLEDLNHKLHINYEEKENLRNIILNRVNNDKIEMNNTAENIITRIDNFDKDFDRLIQSLKNQFYISANTINKLQISKVNINDFEKQIESINQNIEEINLKIESVINKNNEIINQNIIRDQRKNNYSNEENNGLKQELNTFKNDLYNDLEKINIKILDEIKNQARDIKYLYQELNNIKNTNEQTSQLMNSQNEYSYNNNMESAHKNDNNIISLSYIDTELSKKANLDQLNFALETQAKLNEAFSSASRITRFCWDSEGTLKDGKYIKWSIQNINTALDVFRWEKNSENITILQNGVYKIVYGLIGLDNKKNFGIFFNNEENLIVNSGKENSNNSFENENCVNVNDTDKGNIQFMVKYIACIENSNIKAIIFNNNDNENNNNNNSINDDSEEGFLEITKII